MAETLEADRARFLLGAYSGLPDAEYKIDCSFLMGHFALKLTKYFLKRPRVITFVRAPNAYIQSWYQHVLRVAPDAAHDARRCRSLFWNPQSRWLAGLLEPHIAADYDGGLPSEDQLLTKALENLKNLAFVGIVEQMDISLQLLCDYLAWPQSVSHHQLNVTENKLDKIFADDFLDVDRIIYEEAAAQLSRNAARLQSKPSLDLLSEPLLISADGPSSGALNANWYDPEYDPGNGVWRWTGPSTNASIKIENHNTENFDIILCLTGHTAPERLSTIRLRIGHSEPRAPSGVWPFEQGFCLSFNGLPNCFGGELIISIGDLLHEPAGRKLGMSFKYALIAPSCQC